MVVALASVLDVPLREQNTLLLAAGFAPLYREAELDAPELEAVRRALDAILRQQEPFPAVVMNRQWDIIDANNAAQRFFSFMLGPRTGPSNVLRLMFDPNGLRPFVRDWEVVAGALVQRVQREATCGIKDDKTAAILEEILSYPGVPKHFRRTNLIAPQVPVISIGFEKEGESFVFFSAVTTLGTPQDVTLQETRIECFFPANRATEERMRSFFE